MQDPFTAICECFETLERPAAYLRTAVVNASYRWHHRRERFWAKVHLLAPPAALSDPTDPDLADVLARLPYRQRVVSRYWGD